MRVTSALISISLIFLFIFGCGGGGCDNSSTLIYFDEATYYHILSTGQSLSLGLGAVPPLSLVQPFNNSTLDGDSQWGDCLIPLVERHAYCPDGCESPSSGMANNFTYQSQSVDQYGQVIVTMHGIGNSRYEVLKKGTKPFERGRQQVMKALAAAGALGLGYRVLAVTTVHGETDAMVGTGSKYYDYLFEWQADYDEMVKSITRQENDVPLFLCQLSSFTIMRQVYPSAQNAFEIPLAQWRAARDNSNIYMVTPKYHLPYSGPYHLTNVGSRWLGEKYGEILWRVFGLRENWMPLQPDPKRPVIRDGNVIYVKLHVPDPPLVIDTKLVPEQKNYGFSYVDSDGQTQITNVSIVDEDTIRIELSQVPTGRDQKIRYASEIGMIPYFISMGNIRDSDSCVYYYGDLPAYNWLVHFEAEVVS